METQVDLTIAPKNTSAAKCGPVKCSVSQANAEHEGDTCFMVNCEPASPQVSSQQDPGAVNQSNIHSDYLQYWPSSFRLGVMMCEFLVNKTERWGVDEELRTLFIVRVESTGKGQHLGSLQKGDKGEFLYSPDYEGRGVDRTIKVGDILAIDEVGDKNNRLGYDIKWNRDTSTRKGKPHKNWYGGEVKCDSRTMKVEMYGLLHLDKNRDLQKYPLESTYGIWRQNNQG